MLCYFAPDLAFIASPAAGMVLVSSAALATEELHFAWVILACLIIIFACFELLLAVYASLYQLIQVHQTRFHFFQVPTDLCIKTNQFYLFSCSKSQTDFSNYCS